MASSAALAAPRSEKAPAPSAGPAINADFLFEMIVADLHWSSLQIATFCMMTTACAKPETTWSLRSCRHLAYDDTRVMRLALRYSENAGLSCDVAQRLDRLYADLAAMQKQIEPFVEPTQLSSAQREQLHRVLPVLRKLAQAASDALSALEPASRSRLHSNYVDDGVSIRQFLGRAGRGDLGEIDRFGVLSPPRLKQRRQSPRAAVNKPCRLICGTGEFDATLVDVSRGGLGVVCAAPLKEKLSVAVVVEGRRLEATVARADSRQIGLTLRQPLAFTDPLFQVG